MSRFLSVRTHAGKGGLRYPSVIGTIGRSIQQMRESHPELCFWALGGGRPMANAKKSPQGFCERYAIPEKIYPHTGAMVDLALHRFRRKDLARDDILDAIVLAVSAGYPAKSIKTVPLDPPRDEMGLPMEIVYAMPATAGGYSTGGSTYRDSC